MARDYHIDSVIIIVIISHAWVRVRPFINIIIMILSVRYPCMSPHVIAFLHECAFVHVPGCACTCTIVKVRASVRLSVRVSARSICKIVVTSNLCSHVALHYIYRSSLALVAIVLISASNISFSRHGYSPVSE